GPGARRSGALAFRVRGPGALSECRPQCAGGGGLEFRGSGARGADYLPLRVPAAGRRSGRAGGQHRADLEGLPKRGLFADPRDQRDRERILRRGAVLKCDGPALPAGFPAAVAAVRFPANTKARYLLDQTYLTTGYPELVVSGGRGATIQLRYAEALQEAHGVKNNRNEIEGKNFVGY